MSSKAYFEQEIRDRAAELGEEGMDNAITIGLLSLSAYASAARSSMLTQHLCQSLVPVNGETPYVSTGYEYAFGKYSTAYKKIDSKVKVAKKIERYPNHSYTLLVYDPSKEEYDIINREEVRDLAEEFGYKWNNDVIDSYKEGNSIPKDTVVYRSPSIDEYGNYRYGVNAKTVYVISQETIEDAIVVSESFAKRFTTTYVEKCLVSLNDNDIPLNLYGNKEDYKSFPDIGEKTKKSVIFATRRRNKSTDQYAMKNSNLRRIFPEDNVYQMDSNFYIADVDIWSNKPIDEISKMPAYSQVRKYYQYIYDYYTEIYEEFGKIINSGEKYSQEFSRLYAKAKDFLDPSCRYADEDGKIFSNLMIEFTIYKHEKLRVGCKLAGRCGNKSVISKILPDEEMGVTESGEHIDIRCDALGVLGRLNSMQLFDQEINWCAEAARREILAEKNIDKKYKILYEYYNIVAPKEAEALKEFISDKSAEEREKWILKTEKSHLVTVVSPMYCPTTENLIQLVKRFKPVEETIYYIDENGERVPSLKKMIVADEYFMRLKQEPCTKFSVRSKGCVSPMSSLPLRSRRNHHHLTVHSDQANRLGEQEHNVLLLSNNFDALDYFLRLNSSSNDARRNHTLFEDMPDDGFIIDMKNDRSQSVDMMNSYFKAMGNAIVIECDGSKKDKELDLGYEVPEIPKFIRKMIEDEQ